MDYKCLLSIDLVMEGILADQPNCRGKIIDFPCFMALDCPDPF